MTILEYNTEVLKHIRVKQKFGMVTVCARDLREMLFRVSNESEITITTDLLYFLLIKHGIQIYGFKPEKTKLRHGYKLSIDEINKIMPGAFKANKAGAQKKNGVKK